METAKQAPPWTRGPDFGGRGGEIPIGRPGARWSGSVFVLVDRIDGARRRMLPPYPKPLVPTTRPVEPGGTAFGENNRQYSDQTAVLDGSNAVHGILPSALRRCDDEARSVLLLLRHIRVDGGVGGEKECPRPPDCLDAGRSGVWRRVRGWRRTPRQFDHASPVHSLKSRGAIGAILLIHSFGDIYFTIFLTCVKSVRLRYTDHNRPTAFGGAFVSVTVPVRCPLNKD